MMGGYSWALRFMHDTTLGGETRTGRPKSILETTVQGAHTHMNPAVGALFSVIRGRTWSGESPTVWNIAKNMTPMFAGGIKEAATAPDGEALLLSPLSVAGASEQDSWGIEK
jgi:hypothetical protein